MINSNIAILKLVWCNSRLLRYCNVIWTNPIIYINHLVYSTGFVLGSYWKYCLWCLSAWW